MARGLAQRVLQAIQGMIQGGTSRTCRAAAQARRATPNPSLERTANGMAHWPRGAEVHVAPRGQCAIPLSAAQLKR